MKSDKELGEIADAMRAKEAIEKEDFEAWWVKKTKLFGQEPADWVQEVAWNAWYASSCVEATPCRQRAEARRLEEGEDAEFVSSRASVVVAMVSQA